MKRYDVFCKGPFPDGRGGECWVRVAGLDLQGNVDPRRHLSKYMCSVCGVAEGIIRPIAFRNLIPWWDPEYRAYIIAGLEMPARIFPFEKVPCDSKKALESFQHRQELAVILALARVLKPSQIPERDIVRYAMRSRPKPAEIVRERDRKLIVTV